MDRNSSRENDFPAICPDTIHRIHDPIDSFVVVDVQRIPLAYAANEQMARLIFAAPGLIDSLSRLNDIILELAPQVTGSQSALAQKATVAVQDAVSAMNAAMTVEVEDL